MEKSKDKVELTLAQAIARIKELKTFHSSYYGNAIDMVLKELDRLSDTVEEEVPEVKV